MARFFLRLFFAALALAMVSRADDARGTLKGLTAVRAEVLVSGLDAETTTSLRLELQLGVELRLRQSRVKVLDAGETAPGRPVLRILVLYYRIGADSSARQSIDGYAESISCVLTQDVLLQRNKYQSTATTWTSHLLIGVTNSDGLRKGAKESVARAVDEFLNDFLAESTQ